jgi:hypothetical protein
MEYYFGRFAVSLREQSWLICEFCSPVFDASWLLPMDMFRESKCLHAPYWKRIGSRLYHQQLKHVYIPEG